MKGGRPPRAAGLAVAAVLAACGLAGAAATPVAARPLPPADLRVDGGEERWRPQRSFRLLWRNEVRYGEAPVAAVHYRLRDPAGAIALQATTIPWPATSIDHLRVPGPPGAYVAEIWLEDAEGTLGSPATAVLRFDDQPPGPVAPLLDGAWLGRAAFPLAVRLSHPPEPLPVSGIRGYAVAVSAAPGAHPCAAVATCTEAETDLRDGAGADAYLIPSLPEGESHLQAVAVSGSGMASASPGIAVVRVDLTSPATRLAGAPAGWTRRPVTLTATAVDHGSGMAAAAAGVRPFTAIAVDGDAPTTAWGASVTTTLVEEGVHRVAYYARDLAGNVDDGASGNGRPNPPPPIGLVRIDRTPPAVSFAGSQDPADPELIRATVTDRLAGPAPAGGWIGIRRRGSGDRFAPLPAAAAARGELRARWDSDSYPPGEYELRAVGYDAAGNERATTRRADGSAMVLSAPLKAATGLRAGFGGTGALRKLTVPSGRGALLRGRLLGGGRPLGAMPVRIVERFGAAVDPPLRVSTVATAADGAFAIRLGPGPSREVTAEFAGTATLARATGAPLALGVRPAVRLRVSSPVARVGGAPLVFRGRIPAAPGTIPPEGKSVQLQFRLPKLPWTEFRTLQTDRRGRFRYAYRFSDDDSRGVRFLFRAYAPAQGGWPYEPGGSRPVAVRGR